MTGGFDDELVKAGGTSDWSNSLLGGAWGWFWVSWVALGGGEVLGLLGGDTGTPGWQLDVVSVAAQQHGIPEQHAAEWRSGQRVGPIAQRSIDRKHAAPTASWKARAGCFRGLFSFAGRAPAQ